MTVDVQTVGEIDVRQAHAGKNVGPQASLAPGVIEDVNVPLEQLGNTAGIGKGKAVCFFECLQCLDRAIAVVELRRAEGESHFGAPVRVGVPTQPPAAVETVLGPHPIFDQWPAVDHAGKTAGAQGIRAPVGPRRRPAIRFQPAQQRAERAAAVPAGLRFIVARFRGARAQEPVSAAAVEDSAGLACAAQLTQRRSHRNDRHGNRQKHEFASARQGQTPRFRQAAEKSVERNSFRSNGFKSVLQKSIADYADASQGCQCDMAKELAWTKPPRLPVLPSHR